MATKIGNKMVVTAIMLLCALAACKKKPEGEITVLTDPSPKSLTTVQNAEGEFTLLVFLTSEIVVCVALTTHSQPSAIFSPKTNMEQVVSIPTSRISKAILPIMPGHTQEQVLE